MITKRVPPVIADPAMSRVIRDMYEVINELIDAVGKYDTSKPSGESGRVGDISVVKNEDNTYSISVKSGEGWVVSTAGTFTFQGRE